MVDPLASLAASKEEWTESEKWVWDKVCHGEIADFNEKFSTEPELDPKEPRFWKESRAISYSFLSIVLLDEAFTKALPRRGLRVVGAWVKDDIDLSNARLTVEWWIDKSRFEKTVNLSSIKTVNFISLANSSFAADLNLSYIESNGNVNLKGIRVQGILQLSYSQIAQNLFLNEKMECVKINLQNARIGGLLSLENAKVTDKLVMDESEVGNDLLMQDGEFAEISMLNAKLDAKMILSRSTVEGLLDMDGAIVKTDVYFRDVKLNSGISMVAARVGGQLILTGSQIKDLLDMDGLYVESDLLMRKNSLAHDINLTAAKISGQLDLSGLVMTGELDMNGVIVDSDLLINESAQLMNVDLTGANINGNLELDATRIDGPLKLIGLQATGNISLDNIVAVAVVNLRAVKIQGSLYISSCQIVHTLILERLSAGGSLFIRQSDFGETDMRGAKVGDQMEISSSTIRGKLNMNYIAVNNQLRVINGSEFSEVLMVGASVGGQFDLVAVRVKHAMDMQSIFVKGNIFIRDNNFDEKFSLIDSDVEGSIVSSGNCLPYMDLGGSVIKAELQIGELDKENRWSCDSFLNMRNVKTAVLSDGGGNAWPKNINLDGLDYAGLGQGARGERHPDDISLREGEWFVDWLAKETPYSAQPYFRLAKVLDNLGYSEKANRVLYASKERERRLAKQKKLWTKWLGFSLLNLTIGYGYGRRYFRSLIWVLAFVIIGIMVIGTVKTGAMFGASMLDKIGFSMDKMIPFLELNDKYKFDFGGWQLAYFYIHKIIGFLLSSFVLAGLSGITKKSSPEG